MAKKWSAQVVAVLPSPQATAAIVEQAKADALASGLDMVLPPVADVSAVEVETKNMPDLQPGECVCVLDYLLDNGRAVYRAVSGPRVGCQVVIVGVV